MSAVALARQKLDTQVMLDELNTGSLNLSEMQHIALPFNQQEDAETAW